MEIQSQQLKKIVKIAREFGLSLVLLFGSRVKGITGFDSDFDIAYQAARALTGNEKINLNCVFMDVFHSDKIDMVDIAQANPLLKYEIFKNSQLLFGQEFDYQTLKTRAFRCYVDAQPLFQLQDALLKKRHNILKEKIYG